MIRPNVRASFGRREVETLLALTGPAGEERLRLVGIDGLLDDPALFRALLSGGSVTPVSAPLLFYVLVRHALLERELHDRRLADYTAAVLLEFGRLGPQGGERQLGTMPDSIYLVDILQEIERSRGEREFALRVHLGNAALWFAGVFPDFITHRVKRRGAPPIAYYDEVGASGFRSAAAMAAAAEHDVGEILLQFADRFSHVRSALNGLSDAVFFPHAGDAVERVLREVTDRARGDSSR